MTKSELIEILARKRNDVPYKDVEQAVKTFRLFDKERERAVQDVIFGKGIREIAV